MEFCRTLCHQNNTEMNAIIIFIMLLSSGGFSFTPTLSDSPQNLTSNVPSAPDARELSLPVDVSGGQITTMIYLVNTEEVKTIKEFKTYNDGQEQLSHTGTQAIVNEVLINLLKKGYVIESVQEVPTDQMNGVKRCIGLTKPVGVEPTMTLVLDQTSL
jgi:hypothetical protein